MELRSKTPYTSKRSWIKHSEEGNNLEDENLRCCRMELYCNYMYTFSSWPLPFVVLTRKLRTTVWNHYLKSMMAETWYSDLGYLSFNSNRVLLEILQFVSRDTLFFLNCCRLEAISLEVTFMELCMKIPLRNTSCYCHHVRKALSPTLRLLATTLWMWVSSSFSVTQFKVWLVVFFGLKWAHSKLILTQISGFLLITLFVGYMGGLVPILTICWMVLDLCITQCDAPNALCQV